MPCTPFDFGNGVTGIVCTSGRGRGRLCQFCRKPSVRQCDWPALPGRTCDKYLCGDHARSMGPEKDLCPDHAPPRDRVELLGVDTFAPLLPQRVPHGLGCPWCDAGLCHGCQACGGMRAHRIAARRLPGPWWAVVGARDHGNLSQLDGPIDALPPDAVVVSGGARGVDGYGVERARRRGLRTVVLEADWNRAGKIAGFIRNGAIAVVSDGMIAAPWWGCRGTHHSIALAEAVGLRLLRVKPVASQLEVWTARLSPSCTDPDLLNITVATALAAHTHLAPVWAARSAADRVHELVRELRRVPGFTLAEAQRRMREQGAPSIGGLWAPSPKILGVAKEGMREASARAELAALRLVAAGVAGAPDAEAREAFRAEMESIRALEATTWTAYQGPFVEEMRGRFQRFPDAWGWLLGQRRVVLACVCGRPSYAVGDWCACHRFLVADMLSKCGATYRGELPGVNPDSPQIALTYPVRSVVS